MLKHAFWLDATNETVAMTTSMVDECFVMKPGDSAVVVLDRPAGWPFKVTVHVHRHEEQTALCTVDRLHKWMASRGVECSREDMLELMRILNAPPLDFSDKVDL